jgi:hypothetical protein
MSAGCRGDPILPLAGHVAEYLFAAKSEEEFERKSQGNPGLRGGKAKARQNP